MNHTLQQLRELFWASLAIAIVYTLLSYVAIRRRQWWIRFLDAEATWWRRIGLPKLSFDRSFGESRFFTFSLIFFAIAFLLMACAAAVLYIHIRHQAR